MASNDYHFVTVWRIRATVDEIAQILSDAEALARWWPSVYLEVRQERAGDAQGVGKRVSLFTKGWLPYTLRWRFEVTEVSHGGFVLVAEGDFVGRGEWIFKEDGEWVNMTYDWRIEANKPLLRYLSFLFKPLFSINHLWAMRQGELSLDLEVRRRHAKPGESIPPPPPPTPSDPLHWLIYVIRHPHSLHGRYEPSQGWRAEQEIVAGDM
jgi:hypothetical protein